MSKKLFVLISSILGGLSTIASALVAYFQPHMYGAIISAIGIANIAANDIMVLFVEEE